jgi:hypothetical protein
LARLVGACFLLVRARGMHRLKLLAVAILLCLLSLPIILLSPAGEATMSRLQTLQNVEEDGSFRVRLWIYVNYALVAMTDVVGGGIGSTNLAAKLNEDGGTTMLGDAGPTVLGDAGPLEILFTLGWPGCILYLGGLGWLLGLAFSGRAQRTDLAAQAAGAVVLATLAQLLAYNTLVHVMGMVCWSFLGLMLSARLFHDRQKISGPCARGRSSGR